MQSIKERREGCIELNADGLKKAKPLLEELRAKYTFNPREGRLEFIMPTRIHATAAAWLSKWVDTIENSGEVVKGSIHMLAENTLDDFDGDYENFEKTPDAAIFPGDPSRLWPTLVLEVGYSQTYESLLADMDLLLEGSSGGIGKAILIKLEPLVQNAAVI
ncbi:hypothetical protein Egran_02241, partial [Elaphomyces granulatus]